MFYKPVNFGSVMTRMNKLVEKTTLKFPIGYAYPITLQNGI